MMAEGNSDGHFNDFTVWNVLQAVGQNCAPYEISHVEGDAQNDPAVQDEIFRTLEDVWGRIDLNDLMVTLEDAAAALGERLHGHYLNPMGRLFRDMRAQEEHLEREAAA